MGDTHDVARRGEVNGVDMNGFGAPLDLVDFYMLAREVGFPLLDDDLSATASTLEIVAHRLKLAEATGRWRLLGARREPWRYVPGDVVALSALYALALLVGRPSDDESTPPVYVEDTKLARTLLTARSYWLPAGSEDAVLSSDPPDPDVLTGARLVERACVVWFAQPAVIPAGVVPPQAGVHYGLLRESAENAPAGERTIEQGALAAFASLACVARRPYECQLEGLLLVAHDDGHPADGVGWLVRCPADQPDLPDERAVVLGRTSHAGWRGVVELLTAIISWGSWTAPEPLVAPPFNADRTAFRELRKGQTRRREEAGGLAGVLILDASRRPPSPSGPAAGTHASPITHVRRGHFKRVPVGPKDQGGRDVRWIPPTLVNPTGSDRQHIRVYRLPGPPE